MKAILIVGALLAACPQTSGAAMSAVIRVLVAVAATFAEYAFPMLVVVLLGDALIVLFAWFDLYRSSRPALQERLYHIRVRLLSWLHYFEDRADERFRCARRGNAIWQKEK